MRTVVFLFPGAWGNDSLERVLWWFEHQIDALREIDPSVEIVPLVYRGRGFQEIVDGVTKDLIAYSHTNPDEVRTVALCYSMGRQVLAGTLERLAKKPGFACAAHIAGVPSHGVPVLGTLDIFLTAPGFLLRSFGGTVMPADVTETDLVMCGGLNETLALQLYTEMSPEPMWWKIARLFVPGFRVRTEPIGIPTFATLGTRDLIVGRANYEGDNIARTCRPEGCHAIIREVRPDLRTIWLDQARFLLET